MCVRRKDFQIFYRNTIWYGTVRYGTVRYGTVPYRFCIQKRFIRYRTGSTYCTSTFFPSTGVFFFDGRNMRVFEEFFGEFMNQPEPIATSTKFITMAFSSISPIFCTVVTQLLHFFVVYHTSYGFNILSHHYYNYY